MKILIADDSKLLRERIKELLLNVSDKLTIIEAENSIEAFNSISESKPDIGIFDIRMPGGSGLELLNKVRKNKIDMKIIILTNYPDSEYRKISLNNGADYFLSKSDEFDLIGNIIKSYLNDYDSSFINWML